jgi:hypothetical protein
MEEKYLKCKNITIKQDPIIDEQIFTEDEQMCKREIS